MANENDISGVGGVLIPTLREIIANNRDVLEAFSHLKNQSPEAERKFKATVESAAQSVSEISGVPVDKLLGEKPRDNNKLTSVKEYDVSIVAAFCAAQYGEQLNERTAPQYASNIPPQGKAQSRGGNELT